MGEIVVTGGLENYVDRSNARSECAVGPPLSEPLIGQIVLDALDVIADGANRTLTPRTPDCPRSI